MSQITEYHVEEYYPRQPRTWRFPIIEILVIVAIIVVIFLIILYPAFAKAWGNSKRVSCQSNLKQIALGIMQYTQDYDAYPRLAIFNSDSTVGPGSIISWRQAIYPYTKSQELFKCTANPIHHTISSMDNFPQSYDVTDTGPIRLNQSITFSDVPFPETTFLIFEENGDTPQAQQLGVPWDNDSGEAGWTNILYGGHYGGSNYVFCDGHVKWYRPTVAIASGVNMWHLNNRYPVTPRALEKLKAAEKNFAD